MVSHNELYILLTEQKQTKNMDRETRDLEKHLQRTPRKKDNQVISNYFLRKILFNMFFYDFDLGIKKTGSPRLVQFHLVRFLV